MFPLLVLFLCSGFGAVALSRFLQMDFETVMHVIFSMRKGAYVCVWRLIRYEQKLRYAYCEVWCTNDVCLGKCV